MSGRSSTLAALAVLAIVGLAVGCGAEDDKPPTVSEAKATLSKDCQQKASDKPLCDCIADELAKAGNDGEEILAINKTVNSGEPPPEVTKAATACAKFAAP